VARTAEADFLWLALALVLALASAATAQQPGAPAEQRPVSPPVQSTLRTFSIEKPVVPVERQPLFDTRIAAFRSPKDHDSLRTTIGIGYVQGADWGTELLAAGGVAGTQVQFHTLLTKGRDGFVFDQGAISIFDPDSR
jgi:hypothetical protein